MGMAATNQDNERAIIRERLAQYSRKSMEQERAELVETWKRACPEAANERSDLRPLICVSKNEPPRPDPAVKEPDEEWHNDIYFVTVRRWRKDPVFGSSGGMIQIGIASFDGTARHDWRDFQAIKNQIAGDECEALELYPAESRLLDPSNYYTLWCFPGVKRLKIGVEHRSVLDADRALSPQRKFSGPVEAI